MNVLALDLGTHTGWALAEDGRLESGVQVFDVKRGESPGMRYVRFNRWLQETVGPFARKVQPDPHVITAPRIGLVVYEQTHHRGGAATEVAAGFATRVQEWAASYGVEHATVHSATLKKWTTGSGRGDKDAMKKHATQRGWMGQRYPATTDDNEVDAICLLHYALAELVPTRSLDDVRAGVR